MPPALGRKALHLRVDIATAEARVEDGEDALRLAGLVDERVDTDAPGVAGS
jgi:hypothetical protein